MSAPHGLVVVRSRCNDAALMDEWAGWQAVRYLPAVGEAGADRSSHFELTQKPVPGMPSVGFSHVTLHELVGAGWEDRLQRVLDTIERPPGGAHPNHFTIGVDVLCAHGRFADKPAPGPDLAGHILAWVQCSEPDRTAEWDRWLDDEHVPDMLASGAFSAATRWRRLEPARFGANFMTLYDVRGLSIEQAVERSAAVMPGLIAAGRKLACHSGALTLTLRRVPGESSGGG